MASTFTTIAKGVAARRVLGRATWGWVGYGVLAYAGLRLLRRYGIFDKQADRAIHAIEHQAYSMSGGRIGHDQSADTQRSLQ